MTGRWSSLSSFEYLVLLPIGERPHGWGTGPNDLEAILSAMKTVATSTATTSRKSSRPVWWWVGLVIIIALIGVTTVPGLMDTIIHPKSEIHEPGIGDFFPETLIWEGTVFQVNRLVIARIVAAVVICLVVGIVALRMKKVPGRGQSFIEMVAEFVRRNIGIELLGNANGRRYATYLSVIFFGIFAMNATAIIPGINIAASSVVSVPLVFAVFSWFLFVVAGIKAKGGAKFFKEQLFPPGVPWPMYILLTPIEAISTFVVRPVSLTIRLLANMIAGHMLLAICYFGTQALLVSLSGISALSALTFAGAIAVTAFELFVAVLQAYVFTLLSAVYIKLSIESH